MDADKLIRHKLRIKPGDSLPFTGWHNATRQDLAQVFADLNYMRGAEIGVAEGRYSEVLLRTVPGLELLCIDPWIAYERISQELCDGRYRQAVERLTPYAITFMRMPSMDAVREILEESLDFVYIDGRHEFDWVMLDIIEWSKRVRKGGIVSGHDFFHFYRAGVVDAVLAYTRAHNIAQWYITKEKEAS